MWGFTSLLQLYQKKNHDCNYSPTDQKLRQIYFIFDLSGANNTHSYSEPKQLT